MNRHNKTRTIAIVIAGALSTGLAGATEETAHKLELKVRGIHFDREFETSTKDRTQTALGLQLNYESPYFADFIGFGRSDKPTEESFYTFDMHRACLLDFIERLDLARITLVVQDWGGLLGLTLPMEMPQRFERLLIMNTALGTGDVPLSEGFVAWRAYVNKTPDLPCGKLMQRTCKHLTQAEADAYDAPYPDLASKAGARAFPNLVPDRPDAPGAAISRQARDWWMNAWQGESFMAIGATDPVLGPPVMNALRKLIRNCPEPYVHAEGGHFLQEWGEDIAREALSRWK